MRLRNSQNDLSEIITRYEEGLKAEQPAYFDQDTFCQIVEHYLESGGYAQAAKACNIGMEMHPVSADLVVAGGKVALMQGNVTKARTAAKTSIALQPLNPEALLLWAQTTPPDDELSDAITQAEQAALINQEDEVVQLALGYFYRQQGRIQKAITHIKQAIELNNQIDHAWHILTETLFSFRKLRHHLQFYQDQIDKDPYNFSAWFYLGQAYNQLADYPKAAEAFDYCTVIEDQVPEGWFMKGAALMNYKRIPEARLCLEKVLELDPDHTDAKLYIAACHEQEQAFEKAIACYKAVISNNSNCADAWHGVGSCMLAQDRNFEAIHWFNRAIQIDDTKGVFWYGLAQAEYRMGNIISSDEAFDRAANCEPQNAEIYLDWSYLYYDAGDFDRAINLITTGIEECPEDAVLYYRAVIYMLEQGTYKEALNYLEKALVLDFDGHTVLYEFFDNLDTQKALFKIIDQYRPKNSQ